jgi:hypothetical protein
MKQLAAFCNLALVLLVAACANMSAQGDGWITLLDGSNPATLDNWNRIGDANWRVVDGAVVADKGKASSYLVSKTSYKDFQIRAEFWADHNTNSGIHFRASDPKDITDRNSYEANIFDQRKDPTGGTGAITGHTKVPPNMHKVGDKWNTYVITAKADMLTVELNGVQTAQLRDGTHSSGPIALQYAEMPGGVIKYRKLQVRPL